MSTDFWIGIVVGMFAMALICVLAVTASVHDGKLAAMRKKFTGQDKTTVITSLAVLLCVGALMAFGAPVHVFARDTPVPLDIPVNTIFTQTNNWLATFAPIAAIGIGITLALAVLTYLGKMIKSAFV